MSRHRTGGGAQAHTDFEDFGNACRGKVRFTSKRQATGKLRAMRKHWGADSNHDRMNPYKCRSCRHWHFGHSQWRGVQES